MYLYRICVDEIFEDNHLIVHLVEVEWLFIKKNKKL